ncbi:MAG: hypothetical protein JNK78_05595 [Planctomycetes bacterium]|nr:hypothetical protein [Planctomycetota bacterium]
MKVEPEEVIIARDGAKISHDGGGTLLVTADNGQGSTVTIEVPANTDVTWYPPAGWTQVTFRAPGQQSEVRDIEW